MAEVNPYRLQYIPQQDHSQQLYEQMRAPLADMQQRRENEFKAREANREDRRDANADERDRTAERDRVMSGNRSDLRERERNSTYDRGQRRLEDEAMFNRNKLLQQEHEALIRELYEAINTPGQDALTRQNRIHAAQDALQRAGYGTAVNEDTPNGPTLSQAIPEPATAPPEAPPKVHLSPAETTRARHDLEKVAGIPTRSKRLSGTEFKPAPPPPGGTAPQPDEPGPVPTGGGAFNATTQGLGVAPWLPGQSPVGRRRALPQSRVESDAGMLISPDDPLNQIVK